MEKRQLIWKKFDSLIFLLFAIITDSRTPASLVDDINVAMEKINNMTDEDETEEMMRELLKHITKTEMTLEEIERLTKPFKG